MMRRFLLMCLAGCQAGLLHATLPAEATFAWQRLLHYRLKVFGGWESSIDFQDFFLSPDGRTNPEAEWQATRRVFLRSEQPIGEKQWRPQCLYPARSLFLVKLGLASRPNFKEDCPDYAVWLERLQVDSISFVFAQASRKSKESQIKDPYSVAERTYRMRYRAP